MLMLPACSCPLLAARWSQLVPRWPQPLTLSTRQGPIVDAFKRASQEECNALLMDVIAGDGLPLGIVRSLRFKR